MLKFCQDSLYTVVQPCYIQPKCNLDELATKIKRTLSVLDALKMQTFHFLVILQEAEQQ